MDKCMHYINTFEKSAETEEKLVMLLQGRDGGKVTVVLAWILNLVWNTELKISLVIMRALPAQFTRSRIYVYLECPDRHLHCCIRLQRMLHSATFPAT